RYVLIKCSGRCEPDRGAPDDRLRRKRRIKNRRQVVTAQPLITYDTSLRSFVHKNDRTTRDAHARPVHLRIFRLGGARPTSHGASHAIRRNPKLTTSIPRSLQNSGFS